MNLRTVILLLATTTTGLMAGLFYAYTISVNRGLARLKDADYLAAMQSINVAIQNPVFFLSFFGAPIFLVIAVIIHIEDIGSVKFILLLAACVIYILGSFGITVVANVPRNEKLAKLNIEAASEVERAAARIDFERPWNYWNLVRTIASVTAFILLLFVCLA